uniref:Uncharacterized protein n=1 Tax=Avena sativa TaxID=4498 RepID=A0ACD5XFB4_AVESA
MVWLLEDYYDTQHQGYLMAKKHMKLGPLKIRSHGVSSNDMPYGERYTEYIQRLGLLPFITLVRWSTPNLNAAAITALVDRWRPETHTFHLRTGAITPTLQDVSMIFGLPIARNPLYMSTNFDGWHNHMHLLIGMAPEELEDKNKDRVPAATYTWIVENFAHCPEPAKVEVIETHAHVYVWYVLSRTLFADSGELRLETPKGRYDEHNNKFSLSYETKVIEPVGVRKQLQGVARKLESGTTQTQDFAPTYSEVAIVGFAA